MSDPAADAERSGGPSVGWADDGTATLVFSDLSDSSGASFEVVWLEEGEEHSLSLETTLTGGEFDVSEGFRSVPDGVQAAVAVLFRDGTRARSPIRWVHDQGTRVFTDEQHLASVIALLSDEQVAYLLDVGAEATSVEVLQ